MYIMPWLQGKNNGSLSARLCKKFLLIKRKLLEYGSAILAIPLLGIHPITYTATAVAAAKSLQSCPTLCDPIDGSPPGSPVPEILQARTLEWVAISFSNA